MTGIKVNVTKANADELIQRLKNEGENSPADLFLQLMKKLCKLLIWVCSKNSKINHFLKTLIHNF